MKLKNFFRHLRRKKMLAGINHPAGFFGPAWVGAEAIILRNGKIVARTVIVYSMAGHKDQRGKWRRISRQGWENYAYEAVKINKSRLAFRRLDLSNFP